MEIFVRFISQKRKIPGAARQSVCVTTKSLGKAHWSFPSLTLVLFLSIPEHLLYNVKAACVRLVYQIVKDTPNKSENVSIHAPNSMLQIIFLCVGVLTFEKDIDSRAPRKKKCGSCSSAYWERFTSSVTLNSMPRVFSFRKKNLIIYYIKIHNGKWDVAKISIEC